MHWIWCIDGKPGGHAGGEDLPGPGDYANAKDVAEHCSFQTL